MGQNGAPSPVRGSLQLVFCDQGTPQAGWNVYEELRNQLQERGVPREQVRFMHEARNDREKGELFAACRQGRVAVLMGSTERMGVGTNVQARAVALHHLDCPWRPADLAQRDGRILRQGNQNPEVQILRYVTEGSFDTYLWQTVERKARFIGQVMKGRLDVREIEDIGDTALSYAEVKALAAGDTRLMEKAKLEGEVVRLERLERAWHRSQRDLQYRLDRGPLEIEALDDKLHQVELALQVRRPIKGEQFQMEVDRATYRERAVAGQALSTTMQRLCLAAAGGGRQQGWIGYLGGFAVKASAERDPAGKSRIDLELVDVPDSHIRLDGQQLGTTSPAGLVIRLENRLERLEEIRDRGQEEIKGIVEELGRIRAQLEVPFGHGAALAAARSQAARLAAELGELAQPKEPAQLENVADGPGRPPRAPAPVEGRALAAINEQRRSWNRRTTRGPGAGSASPITVGPDREPGLRSP